jgi:protein involved in sex pheromone biosynthesis
MKRLLVLAICSTILLAGCVNENNENSESTEIEKITFKLVADNDTGIIYIKNYTTNNNYVFTPYYSKNGKLCRYDGDTIVEVE